MDKKEVVAKTKEPTEQEKVEVDRRIPAFSTNIIGAIADEVSKTLLNRLPGIRPRVRRKKTKKTKKIENAIFLDTSAIIDGRIFDVIYLGLLNGIIIVPSSILLELKHLADSQDTVKRE